MDCQSAIEILECVRPDSSDLEDVDMVAAREHLESCPECAQQLEEIRRADRLAAEAMGDVPIPAGLQERLLSLPEVTSSTMHQVDSSSNARRGFSRWVGVVSACALLIGAFVIGRNFFGPQTSLAELRELSADESMIAAWDDFDQSFEAELPYEWRNRSLRVDEQIKGHTFDEQRHDVAAFSFQFLRGRRWFKGTLIAIPASEVTDLPSATRFSSANVVYIRDEIATVAWTSDSTVYVCYVSGGPGNLEAMQQSLMLRAT